MNFAFARRTMLVLAGCLLAAGPALAQSDFPNRNIRIIVPYAAGGLPDNVARILAVRLQERLGQGVIVENRPGGAGSVAVQALTSAPADGYTLLVTDGSTVTTNPILFKNHPYSADDVAPIALLARSPLFLAVHHKLPVKTIQEFVEYVKARPDTIDYGSSGIGSPHHLSMEALKSALDLKMTHVPYRGTGQSVPALLGGHVSVLFSAYPSLSGAMQKNTVRLLANNGSERSKQAPDIPALGEIIPGYDLATMIGIFGPAGLPEAVIDKIASASAAIVKMPQTAKQFAGGGFEPATGGPQDFVKALAAERERVAEVIKSAKVEAQ